MKKLLLIIISVLSLQIAKAQTTNPCQLYLNGYNQTNYTDTVFCGGDSISLLIQGGGGVSSSVVMSVSGDALITSNASIQPTAQQPTYNISFLAPYLNTTNTYTFTLTLEDTSCADANGQLFTVNYSITILASTQMSLYFPNGVCENNSPFMLLNQGFPLGGIFSGNGVVFSGGTYSFDPGLAGLGWHTITYTTSLGTPCNNIAIDSILVKAAPTVSVNDTSYCEFDPFPIVTPITTGVVNSYLWKNLGNNNQYTTPTLACAAGNYWLRVKSPNGCQSITTFTVTEHSLPVANIVASSYCLPATLTQIPNNPNYTYLWNTGQTTAFINVNTPMLYHLTVTDTTTGCVAEDSIALCPPGLGCPSQDDILCPGDTATLCFHPCIPGLQYAWSTGETTPCISTPIPGTYQLLVTDPATGGAIPFNYTVNSASLNAQILGGDSLYCINDYISLSSASVPSGTSFQWSTSTGYIPINPNDSVIGFPASYLGIGIHQVYLEVQNGICIDYDTISFEIMPSISGIDGDSIVCFGDSVHLFASPQDPSYSYSWLWWDNGIMHTATGASLTFLPTTATYYQLTVSNSICTSSYVANIPFYNNFNVPFIGDTLMCSGDSLQIAVDLPNAIYDFLWMNGDTSAGITVYTGGTYTVDVTLNSIGCTVTNSINITVIPSPSPQTIYGDTNMCSNGLDSLWTDSISGLHYTWTGNVHDTMLYVYSSGTYSLLITDTTTNCSAYQEITISEFPLEQYYIFPEPDTVMCAGDSVRLIVLDSITGAAPPNSYSVLWNTGATTNAINAGATGTYWAAVTDLNGCTDTAFINITVNALPSVSIVDTLGTACEDSTLLVLTSPNTNINLNNSSWANDSLWVYQSGIYSVSVVDSNGCSATDSINIVVNLFCCDAPAAYIRLENGGTSADLTAQNNGSSSFYNDTILIKDTLFVDNTAPALLFHSCNIIMGPYAVIWVEGSSLEITKSHIHACNDTMWQGIYVIDNSIDITGSIIEDAIEAVVMSPDIFTSRYLIYSNYFKNNIYSLICNSPTDNTSTFTSNHIANPAHLKINPAGVDSSFTGIYIDNVYNLTIGGTASPSSKNYFEDLQYGIVAIRSVIEVYNNHFENIHLNHSNAINPNYNVALNSACVYGRGWTSFLAPFKSTIGSTAPNHQNTFKDFTTGVYSEILNTDVIGNNFYNGTNVGVYTQNASMKVINILENYMQDVYVGVGAITSNWANYNVIDNEIIGQSQQQFLGVNISNWSSGGVVNLDISKNCIDNYLEGIGQGYVNGARIEANYIKDSQYGIASFISSNGVIQSNRIVGSNSSHINGTYAYLSRQLYQCNSIEDYRTAMYFRGTCSSRLQQNTLYANPSYSDNGIMIDFFGSIGTQGNPATFALPTISWHNQWVGYGAGGVGPSQIHTDNWTVGSSSNFFVRPLVNHIPWNSTNAFSSTFVPHAWAYFIVPPTTCTPLPTCNFKTTPPAIPNVEFTELAQLELEALMADGSYNPDAYQNQEELYRELVENPELVDSSLILENFRDSVEQTDMGRLVRIEKAIADSPYVEAAAINDSILGVNNIEITAKSFYQTHLAPHLRGEAATDFTVSELSNMRSIANLCPFTHGALVYAARALCRYHDALWVDYKQPCELPNTSSNRLAAPEELINVFNIYPNPARDRVSIKIQIIDREALLKLHIVNNLGQILESYNAASQQELSIDVSHLPSGIYLLNLADIDGNSIATKKLTKE